MELFLLCTIALLASLLTFFSGFGLGTLLLPAMALFMPIEQAVASTAVVHFLNGLFKLVLVGKHADRAVLLRFGITAVLASLLGAWLLSKLGQLPSLFTYQAFDHTWQVTSIKAVIGALLIFFAAFEIIPRLRDLEFGPKWMPIGGLLSGFFGGLAGMQGALRSAFLARAGLSKEAFVATGTAIGCLIDATRLGTYGSQIQQSGALDWALLVPAILCAFIGAYAGSKLLKKVTLPTLQVIVATMLFAFGLSLVAGWI